MIALGSDHGGLALKRELMAHFDATGVEYKDFGTYTSDSCNYVDYATLVCDAVVSGECEKGILCCGTGIGISIAANKINGIRAAVCSEHFSARYCRLHNDANVLCMGGRTIGPGVACELADIFLTTEFEGGRHAVRLAGIAALEERERGK